MLVARLAPMGIAMAILFFSRITAGYESFLFNRFFHIYIIYTFLFSALVLILILFLLLLLFFFLCESSASSSSASCSCCCSQHFICLYYLFCIFILYIFFFLFCSSIFLSVRHAERKSFMYSSLLHFFFFQPSLRRRTKSTGTERKVLLRLSEQKRRLHCIAQPRVEEKKGVLAAHKMERRWKLYKPLRPQMSITIPPMRPRIYIFCRKQTNHLVSTGSRRQKRWWQPDWEQAAASLLFHRSPHQRRPWHAPIH